MRIKAFTLVEMLLVLVLSAIVVAVAYAVYTQVHLFHQEYQKRTTDSVEFLSLDQHLRFDANRAADITASDVSFTFESEMATLAHYTVNAAGIHRSAQGQTDNFNVPIRKIQVDSLTHQKILTLHIGPENAQTDTFRYPIQLPASAQIRSSK
jgi:prepilin-type N-terminal cleavage/methylation domain-containing protein